ncbi:MAG: DUF2182 domain-containing protein [Pseudomonadota bacterium]
MSRPALMTGKIDWTEHRTITMTGIGLSVLAAWLALAAMHNDTAFALDTLAALCLQVGGGVALELYPAVLTMWLLMSVAMMLPTAIPTIDLYVRLSRRMEVGRGARILLFTLGYILAWSAFGVIAAAAQIGLGNLPVETLPPLIGGGAILILAGTYQLSALKQKCLDLCRNPLLFFMSRWTETIPGTLALGIRHGIICIGCCWALMLLMFIGGTMNLLWMALLGLAMLAEKIVPGAARFGRHAGGLMIVSGSATVISHFI